MSAYITIQGVTRRISTKTLRAVRTHTVTDAELVRQLDQSPFEVAMRQAAADNAKMGLGSHAIDGLVEMTDSVQSRCAARAATIRGAR